MQQEPPGQFYARKVGQTQREIQSLEHQRRRLVGVADHAFIDLEVVGEHGDEAETGQRAADIRAAAAAQTDELLRLTVEILVLQDRLHYYRQLEALYAEGSVGGPN